MGPEDQIDTLVIIFIADIDFSLVNETAQIIKERFSPQLETGVLEVISPPIQYYPNWTNLEQTLGKQGTYFKFFWPKYLKEPILFLNIVISTLSNQKVNWACCWGSQAMFRQG